MKREIEALLFASDSPLSLSRLRKMFPDEESSAIKAALAELEADYTAAGHAFTVVEFGGGWQVATRPEYAPLVEKLLTTRKYTRLSRAGLEVLAIIAYRQPITRLEVDEIRGVQSSGALATLQERNLVTVVGRSEAIGHPLLYGTTREFLFHLGLKGLSQLPDLPTLEEVVENRDDLRAFASQFGEELTDEDFETLAADEDPDAEELAEIVDPTDPEIADAAPDDGDAAEPDPAPDAPAPADQEQDDQQRDPA
ncbi:MAG: SMC-Scp complex subunit ScpB [Candidatus Krumholzibacteriia bacterium]